MVAMLEHLIVLGRVASGLGGNAIVDECKRVLREQYPERVEHIKASMSDEKMRRVGQSVAVTSLPEL